MNGLDEIAARLRRAADGFNDKLNDTILKIVRDSWPHRPRSCTDAMCGAEDCRRCHPTPYSHYEESHTESEP